MDNQTEQEEGCEWCLDPDGVCCYPTFGLAPHVHNISKTGSVIGSTEFLPKSEWPDNFTPDKEDETTGIWHCAKCGAGKPEKV